MATQLRTERAGVAEPAISVMCVACGSPRTAQDVFFYRWREQTWWIRRCLDCTHQFVWPSVTEAEQAVIYGDQYFTAEGDWSAGWFGSYAASEAQLRDEARTILAMLPVRSGRLLDLGCAGGFFLDEARRAGFEVAGIEYNAQMVAHAQALGLDVRQGRIEDISLDAFPAASFDVVTILDVLEHLPTPHAAITRAARWSRPGSHLLIRGPLLHDAKARMKESLRRLAGRVKQLDGYPLDANMWNRRSLAALLARDGYQIDAWIGATPMFANVLASR